MINKKLEAWSEKLLDTGKRNNMINFKNNASTVEVVYPSAEEFYDKCQSASSFEIFDPKIIEDDDFEQMVLDFTNKNEETNEEELPKLSEKEKYIKDYSKEITKNNQILAYSKKTNSITAVKNIAKKARDYLEETGVNVAYMAFGFVRWKESISSSLYYRAPLLLVPIYLKNNSAIDPWYIELAEDDVIVNPTFDHLLQAQYSVKLPEYEEDESLTSYLDKVRKITSKLNWEVLSECKIAIFSFLKINMYHDLIDNEEEILENENIKLLIGEETSEKNAGMSDGENVVKNEIIDLHAVVDADSSQIEAIEMAKAGKSFVLQGPPGTGKSQTITNIIAECLYDGKKVLFVSEKQAALSVVYDKLKHVGLEEFCLELHSHKASKKEVISELCKTLRTEKSRVSSRADAEVLAKAKLQQQLDSYAEELHKVLPTINKSMYQLYEAYSAYRKAPELEYVIEGVENLDELYYTEAVSLLKQYEEYTETIGKNYKTNAWYGFNATSPTYDVRSNIREDMQELDSVIDDLKKETAKIHDKYNLDIYNTENANKVISLFKILIDSDCLKAKALNLENVNYLLNTIPALLPAVNDARSIRDVINTEYEDAIYKVDGKDIYNKLVKLYNGFFSRLFNAEYKQIINDYRLASREGKKLNYESACKVSANLGEYQEKNAVFENEKKKIESLVDNITVDTEFNKLLNNLVSLKSLFEGDFSCEKISELEDQDFNNEKANFKNYIGLISEYYEKTEELTNKLQKYFDVKKADFKLMSFDELKNKLEACLNNMDMIENWIRFDILLKQLEERNLISYVDYTIEEGISSNLVTMAYKRLFYKQWINHVIYKDPIFAGFTRISQDRAVEEFAKKDKLQFDISKAQIKAELSNNRPSLDMLAGGSAVSILLREGEKKRKQMSIRKLIATTGDLVQIIKPCFLMSPLSVSTFLSGSNIKFDTVVFDEASQIFPQDAIGAIYRGKQLIVVGDSKQMPPSNFFNSSLDVDDDDEEKGDVADFESILDLCSTAFSQMRLRWHYRSRYEQLISFSNKNFYDNTLVTFPSSKIDHKGIGVDYYFVKNGLFNRTSHTNREEADYIVDLIYKNIDDYPNRSLGVVAFSKAQQDLIDRLLSRRRQEDPSKEWFFKFDDTTKEPFFIKNLETVQGDERDTIIFSVAYGKDIEGRLYHNFGPLNRVGGERRLNVAVTRAKENVQLVASIHATDIDLSRTNSVGAKLLREYLDYAENGNIALERSIDVNPFEQFDSEFEMEVCEFLRDHGFKVDTQVGSSGFRIDLALKREDSSDYVLAIECDGATYHSSKNARDRDRLRQEILENMGWRFYRIWSTDWFRNPVVEKEKLLKAATQALHLGAVSDEDVDKVEEPVSENIFEKEVEEESFRFKEYKEENILKLWTNTNGNLPQHLKVILETEAPISEEILLKNISFIYGRDKVTSKVKDMYYSDMRDCAWYGIVRRKGFLYREGQTEFELRVPGDRRQIKNIALEELAAGFKVLLEKNVTAQKDGLFKALIKLLGFSSLGAANMERLEEALQLLDIEVDGDMITLKK